MTEYASSKNVSTAVFINLFSLTLCPANIDIYLYRIDICVFLDVCMWRGKQGNAHSRFTFKFL